MSEETKAREDICRVAKSMFDRGLTYGASGNISLRLSDGSFLVTPTGHALGDLYPTQISHVSQDFRHLSGAAPTKETPLHAAFYETRDNTGAVVHLHSTYSVALSLLPETDPENAVPPLTPYAVMRVGQVKLLPFFVPGDPAMGDAIRNLNGQRSAVLLANHGPVVAASDLFSAVYAMEELEETSKLALLTRGMQPNLLTEMQIKDVIHKRFQ